MFQRIYVSNFRCLVNFDFKLSDSPSVLLVGKNGTGKSTVRAALKIFQSIGHGITRVGRLVDRSDSFWGKWDVPMRFELEVALRSRVFRYALALEWPEGFREARILEERLDVDGEPVFSRKQAEIVLPKSEGAEAQFSMDWHVVALPLIHVDVIGEFQDWLKKMILLSPVPEKMSGSSEREEQRVDENAANWADWLFRLLSHSPAAYERMSKCVKQMQGMRDLESFRFVDAGLDTKLLKVRFNKNTEKEELFFNSLSDGEKIAFLRALVLSANEYDGPFFVFWDEPDHHLSPDETSQFVFGLRKGFQGAAQIFVSSHNPETIRQFSDNNTWILGRKSHFEPTIVRRLDELMLSPGTDLIQELMDGEIEP
ncbi:MAG: AAA family ATPase [Candidatus Accumulibacter sp.]|nr:AAA family ATPase [Accumulibacter sp.]